MLDINYQYKMLFVVVLVIYFIILLSIGLFFKNKTKSLTDFVLAGRNLPFFIIVPTIVTIWLGAGPFMGGAANSYLFGLHGVISDPFSATLCLVLMAIFFAKILRNKKYYTVCDLFFSRYGDATGLIGSVIMIFIEIGWIGSQLVAMSAILKIIIDIPVSYGLIISCLIVATYTSLGGMKAVSITGILYFLVISIGLLLTFPFIIYKLGGFEIFKSANLSMFDIPVWSMVPTKNEGYLGYTGINGWIYYIGAWLSIGLGSLCAQDLVQPILSSKSEKDGVKASFLSAPIYLLLGIIGPLLGLVFFVYKPGIAIGETELIIPYLGSLLSNPVISIIFFIAIFSILLSTCSGASLAVSTIVGCNLLSAIKSDIDEQSKLLAIKISIPISIFTALFLALNVQTVYRIMVISWTILLVGLMASFFAAFFWKKANQTGSIISILTGIYSWIGLIMLYLPITIKSNTDIVEGEHIYWEWAIWDAVYISSTWAFLISLVTLIVVSLLSQKFDPPKIDNF